jgi:uncharacterized protein YecT (DUF1311 family)
MPKELNDAFQDTIKRIESQPAAKRTQGLKTLQWVFLAERQLSTDELRQALSIQLGD